VRNGGGTLPAQGRKPILLMYQALEIKTWIKVVGGLGILISLALWWYAPPNDSPWEWIKHVSTAAGFTATVLIVLGSKWVFPHFWKLRLVQALSFPYVAGEWTGTISSNWPVKEAMMDAFVKGQSAQGTEKLDIVALGTETKRVKVTIEADLFNVIVKLETLDKYSTSYSLHVQPQRGGALRRSRLCYIYQNDTQVPVNTDAESHFGAAFLEVSEDGKTLEGTYWTARNWTKGLNTAGRIVLRRSDDSGSAAQ
jgi:hypothetical protein